MPRSGSGFGGGGGGGDGGGGGEGGGGEGGNTGGDDGEAGGVGGGDFFFFFFFFFFFASAPSIPRLMGTAASRPTINSASSPRRVAADEIERTRSSKRSVSTLDLQEHGFKR